MYDCLLKPYRFCSGQASPLQSSAVAPLPASINSVIDRFYGVPIANKAFVDRPDILGNMKAVLVQGSLSSECTILALCGLGGMGKTQLMSRYCYLHCDDYDFIFWLEFDSRVTALQSFHKLAANLGFDGQDGDSERRAAFVRGWLQQQKRWLLLLDNVDDLQTLEFLPRVGGHIILTTREFLPRTEATSITIGKMRAEEALSLFLGPSSTINPGSLRYSQAQRIVAELDYMALAVNLAQVLGEGARNTSNIVSSTPYVLLFEVREHLLRSALLFIVSFLSPF